MIQISRPQSWWQQIFSNPALYEALAALFAAGIGVLSALRFFQSQPPERFLGGLAVVLVIGVLLATWQKLALQVKSKSQAQNPHELTGCLHTLHEILRSSLEEETDPCLRLTVHLVIENGNQIEQVLDYVGDDRGGGGRRFRAACGITGNAIKSKAFVVATRQNDDYSRYLKELVEAQGYREEEAKKLNPATMSWVALPLVESQKVVALIYCDATVRDFFSPERQLLIQGAGAGTARFVAQRYNKS